MVDEEDVVELDDVDTVVPVVEVVGRALATVHSVAHNITENFMSAEPRKIERRKWVGNTYRTSSREQFYTSNSSSRLFSIVHRNSLCYFVIVIHLFR